MKTSFIWRVLYISSFLLFLSCEEGIEKAKKDIESGLIAYYTFDGNDVSDSTPNKMHGITVNSPEYVSETSSGVGKAIFLNGIKEQYINIPYNPFAGISSYSISMWVKDFGQGVLFSAINSDYLIRDYPRLLTDADGKFIFYIGSTNSPNAFSYNYREIQDNRWHMVTVVCEEKGNKHLYIDGKLVDSSTDYVAESTCTKIQIGGDGDGKYSSYSSSMKVDNVRFYNRSLSRIEVEAIYIVEL